MVSLSKMLPERVKTKIKYLLSSSKNEKYAHLKKDEQKVFVFLAGFYQNLGDMAITYSQKKFLQDLYPQAKIVLVPSTETYQSIKAIKKKVNRNDIITLIGGGNIDDKYQSLEDARIFVVKSFPNNKIISFPQTACFSNTKKGSKSLKRSSKAYSKHKDILMFMRENNALERAKKYFKNVDISICPDIVLYLNKTEPKVERVNVLCCLRKDKEQNISSEVREQIINLVKQNCQNVILRDTVDVELKDCQIDTYEKTLKEFWAMLRECKVVVTDRLHCMIFCAITGTPCVVMDNTNKKISGVYNQWLNGTNWIKLIENYDEKVLLSYLNELYSCPQKTEIINLEKEFEPLRKACELK